MACSSMVQVGTTKVCSSQKRGQERCSQTFPSCTLSQHRITNALLTSTLAHATRLVSGVSPQPMCNAGEVNRNSLMPSSTCNSIAGELSTTGMSTNFVLCVEVPTDCPSKKWILQGAFLNTVHTVCTYLLENDNASNESSSPNKTLQGRPCC